jgi:hypothetical protein
VAQTVELEKLNDQYPARLHLRILPAQIRPFILEVLAS